MNTNHQNQSPFYQSFKADIDALSGIQNDSLLNRLVFSQTITVMEKYLYDVFIHEISSDPAKLQRLANENKFKEQKLAVAFALNNNVSDWIVDTMKKMVWHRLNDIHILYKNVLSITFNLKRPVIDAINKRHHLVHRNGFDIQGNVVSVTKGELNALFSVVDDFISNIDDAYMS